MNSQPEIYIPYSELEKFGLTQEMIEDLPEYVIETIMSGGRSPLLPITVPVKYGSVEAYAKFRLVASVEEEGIDILFYPKLTEAPLEGFTEEERQLLNDGRTIVADIDITNNDGETHKEKFFVQIDKDTNHVFYVNTPIIARNLKGLDTYLNLSSEEFQTLANGQLITIGEQKPVTIGIDIFSDAGIFLCQGTELNWHRKVGKAMPEYSFGVEGCWVNKDGLLKYIKEDDFDSEIESVRQKLIQEHLRNAEINQANGRGILNKEDKNQLSR